MKQNIPNGPDSWIDQNVLFGDHLGTFKAEVYVNPKSVAVIAKKAPVLSNSLKRKRTDLEQAQWHISPDHGGNWNPSSGVFILPREALTRITDKTDLANFID